MATVGSSKPGVSPVLLPEHHGHRDCEQSHDHKKRPTRAERIRRGRHRDKLRVQTLRDQLAAACSSSSDSSASEDQPQLAASLTRISDLEKQNQCLRRLVEELTHSLVLPTGPASPELFDVYDIAEETANVATQTEISVNFQSPDIFVRVQDLPVCAAECHVPPQCAAGSHLQPLATAHADAAAGFDAAHATPNRLRNFTSISQAKHSFDQGSTDVDSLALESTASGPSFPRQAPDDVHARHRGHTRADDLCEPLEKHVTSGDFNSQSLSFSSELLVTVPRQEPEVVYARHRGHVAKDAAADYKSHSKGSCSPGDDSFVFESTAADLDPPRQTPDDGHARHREFALTVGACEPIVKHESPALQGFTSAVDADDFNSQSLASFNEPLVEFPRQAPETRQNCSHVGNKEQHHGAHAPQYARQEHEVANAMHRVSSPADFNSQDLALTAVPFASGASEQCTAQELEEPHSKHRVSGSSDFNSQNLALTARPFAFGTREQGDKEQHQVAHAPQSTRQELEVVNTKHRVSGPQDFNSQNLASSAEPFAFGDNEQYHATHAHLNTRQELEVANAKHRVSSPSDFNSQNLALPAGHLAFGTKEHGDKEQHRVAHTPLHTRQELEVAKAMHRESGSQDFNSQDLARSAEPFAFGDKEQHRVAHAHQSPWQEFVVTTAKLTSLLVQHHGAQAHQSTRQELDVANAKHRVSLSQDLNSQNLALLAVPVAFGDLEQHHAACAHLGTRQELEATNAKQLVSGSLDFNSHNLAQPAGPFSSRVADSTSALSFGPSARETQRVEATNQTLDAQVHLSTRQALDDVNAKHRVSGTTVGVCDDLGQDFRVAVAPIIGAYCKRKKPTNSHVRTAAKAIISIALKHEVSYEACCSYLKGQSMALWCATTDLWGMP